MLAILQEIALTTLQRDDKSAYSVSLLSTEPIAQRMADKLFLCSATLVVTRCNYRFGVELRWQELSPGGFISCDYAGYSHVVIHEPPATGMVMPVR